MRVMESHGLEMNKENFDEVNSDMQETLEPGEIDSSDSDVGHSSSVSSYSLCDAFYLSKDTSIEIENCYIEKNFTHEGRRVYLKNSPLMFMKNQYKENDKGYNRKSFDLNSEKSYLKKMKRRLNHTSKMQDGTLIKEFKKLSKKIELNLYKLKKIKNCITKSKNDQCMNLPSPTTGKRINKYKKELLDIKYLNTSNNDNDCLQLCFGSRELIQTTSQHNSSQLNEHKINPLISKKLYKSTCTQEDIIMEFSDRTSKEEHTQKTKLKKTSSETSIISHSSLKCSSDISNKSSDNSKSFSATKTNRSNYTNMNNKTKIRSLCDSTLQYDNTKNYHNKYWHVKHKTYLQSHNFNENSHSTSRFHKSSSSKYISHSRLHRREFLSTNDINKNKSSDSQVPHNYIGSSKRNKYRPQNHEHYKRNGHRFPSRIYDYRKRKYYQSCLSNNSAPYMIRSPLHYGHQTPHFSEQYKFYDEQYNKYTSANEQNKSSYFSMKQTKYSEKQNYYSKYLDQEFNIPVSGAECSPICHQIQSSHNGSLSLENDGQHTNVSLMPNFITTQTSCRSESRLHKMLDQPPPPGVESPSHLPLPAYTMETDHRNIHLCDNQHSPFPTSSSKCKHSHDKISKPNTDSNRHIDEEVDKENYRNQTLLKSKISLVTLATGGKRESYKSLGQSDPIVEYQDTNTNQNLSITNKQPLSNRSEKIDTNTRQNNLPINVLDTNEFAFSKLQNLNISNMLQPRCLNFDERNKNNDPINICNTKNNSNEKLETMHCESQVSCSMLINCITHQRMEKQSELFTVTEEYNNNSGTPAVSTTQNNLKEAGESNSFKQNDSQNGISVSINQEYSLSNNVKEDSAHNELISMHHSHKNTLTALIEANTQEPLVNNSKKQQELVKPCMENVIENLCNPQTINSLKYVYQKIYNFNIYPEETKKSMGQISTYIKHRDVFEDHSDRNAIFYAYHKNEDQSYKSKITFQKSEQSFIVMNDIRSKRNVAKMICYDVGVKQSDIKIFNNPLPPIILKHDQSTDLQTPQALKYKKETKAMNKSATEEKDKLHNKNKALSSLNIYDGVMKSCKSLQANETIVNQPKVSIALSRRDGKSLKTHFTAETERMFKKTATISKTLNKNINITFNEDKSIGSRSNKQVTNQDRCNKLSIYKGGLDSKHGCKKHKICGNKMPTKSKQNKKICILNYSLCWHCRNSTKSVGSFANIANVPN